MFASRKGTSGPRSTVSHARHAGFEIVLLPVVFPELSPPLNLQSNKRQISKAELFSKSVAPDAVQCSICMEITNLPCGHYSTETVWPPCVARRQCDTAQTSRQRYQSTSLFCPISGGFFFLTRYRYHGLAPSSPDQLRRAARVYELHMTLKSSYTIPNPTIAADAPSSPCLPPVVPGSSRAPLLVLPSDHVHCLGHELDLPGTLRVKPPMYVEVIPASHLLVAKFADKDRLFVVFS